MKRIICFDTSIASSNLGDYIIMESCKKQLEFIFKKNYVLYFPTHTPVSHWYQNFKKTSGGRYNEEADYKFLCGTNLINSNMLYPTPTWNVNIFNNKMAKDVICVGVGMGSEDILPNTYTKMLYKSTLNKNAVHSTRDEKTAKFLRSLGFKAICTGCATTWELDNVHCSKVPKNKSENVVFTLTDYKKDIEKDQILINILKENYKTVYFWVQGIEDYDYLKKIGYKNEIKIIEPSVEAYDNVLNGNVDFVGTRLHAGIKAMQKMKRTIIITVDNRTVDMKKYINLITVDRNEIEDKLANLINSNFSTKLNINLNNINEWKSQFNEWKS